MDLIQVKEGSWPWKKNKKNRFLWDPSPFIFSIKKKWNLYQGPILKMMHTTYSNIKRESACNTFVNDTFICDKLRLDKLTTCWIRLYKHYMDQDEHFAFWLWYNGVIGMNFKIFIYKTWTCGYQFFHTWWCVLMKKEIKLALSNEKTIIERGTFF
jgi:hypothetical protein